MMKRAIAGIVLATALVIGAVVGLVVYFARRPRTSNNTESGLVVIVGAGVSGARAAVELSRAKKQFVILEAKDVVGGRLVQGKLGNLSVELGANWIHDYGDGHEVETLAEKIKLAGVPTDTSSRAYYNNGEKLPSATAWKSLQDSWRKAIAKSFTGSDITVIDALSTYAGWKPRTALECAMLQYLVDYSTGVSYSRTSAFQVSIDDVEESTPESEYFIKDNRGYVEIVHHLLREAGINNTKTSGDKLKLGAPVRMIEYNEEGAKVYLRNGFVYNASAVISTVSLGVLKENKIVFKPRLPDAKRTALSKMVMGSYTKIFVQLSEPVLTANDPMLLIPTNCDQATNVHNLNKPPFFPGSNAVLVTVMGGYQGDEKAIVVRALQSVTKRSIDVSLISNISVLDFDSDEFIRGAYSNRLVGFTSGGFAALTKPEGSLYFAGEMFGEDDFGSVKSAWTSGEAIGKRAAIER